jgi:hypothetical protein
MRVADRCSGSAQHVAQTPAVVDDVRGRDYIFVEPGCLPSSPGLNNSLIDLVSQVKLGQRVRGQLTQIGLGVLAADLVADDGDYLPFGVRSIPITEHANPWAHTPTMVRRCSMPRKSSTFRV